MRQEHVLTIVWSAAYRPTWDATPEAYVESGVVGWSRSRRLARAEDASIGFKAYVGVQHYDPSRWHVAGAPRAVFFVSFFQGGRTLALRTFPTIDVALAELRRVHAGRAAPLAGP
ncbi:MAG TPA: hypothetical protein VE258_13765, partial [Ktedonobacterales bacterium]|nr:hypothetical protein [Ktedonobacterales bacterium]